MSAVLLVGVGAVGLALGLLTYLVVAPGPPRVSRERLDPDAPARPGVLSGAATAATSAIGAVMQRRRWTGVSASLARAGSKTRPQDFVFLVLVACGVAAAAGLLIGSLLLSVVLVALVLLVINWRLNNLAAKRMRDFNDQLDDSLQLMASSLRAGHSLLQALDAVAREAEQPTSEEFARIINETRVGRDLGQALTETAYRNQSDDFLWAAQAIEINRVVGGNLAEVLDGVGHTIRERNQIRRQVKALSAEGRLSAIILMLLPFGVALILMVANPAYIGRLTEDVFGWVLLAISAILLLIGGFWLSRVVKIKF